MVSKKPSRHVIASHKHVKLKRHHSKPFRKRHVGLLVASLDGLVILAIIVISYRDQLVSGLASSRGFVGDLFVQNKNYKAHVTSIYGFKLDYDQQKFYASGISSESGDLYIGNELAEKRAYSVVRIAPNFSTDSSVGSSSALTLTYHTNKAGAKDVPETIALQDGGLDAGALTKKDTAVTTLGDQTFTMTTWESKTANTLLPSLNAKFVTYSGTIGGNIVTVVLSLGVGDDNDTTYADVLESISFNTKLSAVNEPSDEVVAKTQSSRSLLDVITNTSVASAATNKADLSGSEKVAALYSPAVVKIYNAYCMDIAIDSKVYLTNACRAASGSGFFVSQDGYLATNGHVAATSPLDVVITDALTTYSTKGDPKYFNFLLTLSGLKPSDIPTTATTKQKLGIMVDAMYSIDESRVTATKDVQNLFVQVTPKNPDITELLKATKDRKEYSGDSSVIAAKLVAADFRANDGYDGFKASDVAIIKVDGINFPIVKLGSIDSAVQGADLSILGYPGNASDNGIVDSTSSQATLTTGKVSSKKNAANSDKKLIETDTTIGHGNSGGPALTDDGEVVGIATYTADGSGEGDGVYNYIRDIKDLTDLADSNDIIFDTESVTQSEWEEGISNFYTSHYSKALLNFRKVQTLYPNNSRVAEFITASEKRIANGEDVVDFPLVPVIVASVIVFIGIAAALLLIVRHHKKHVIYNAGVAQGSVMPAGRGVGTQKVFVSPNGMTVDSPLPLSSAPAPVNPPVLPGAPPVTLPPPLEPVAPLEPIEPLKPVEPREQTETVDTPAPNPFEQPKE